jgi:hypothetical protein
VSRLTSAVARILSDPANRNRTADEVADAVIDTIRQSDARSQRIAVVGQISLEADWPASERRRTVVLGPFSGRGIPDTEEKFQKATEGPSGAKTAGYGLAWDAKTGTGRGRFTLAPVFSSAREAWNFWRPELAPLREVVEGAVSVRTKHELPPLCYCSFVDRRACPKHGEK